VTSAQKLCASSIERRTKINGNSACRSYLAQQVVTEVGHELSSAAACHILVAEELKGFFQRLVKETAVGKAVTHVQHVLVMQLNDLTDKVLLPSASCSMTTALTVMASQVHCLYHPQVDVKTAAGKLSRLAGLLLGTH